MYFYRMIVAANPGMYDELIAVWESSVRATHDFITEDYLQEIKALLPDILPQVNLVVYRDNDKVVGFAGVAGQKLEMLFVLPERMGKGIGKTLLLYCIDELQVNAVDVNEQNKEATGFYEKMGFTVHNRKPLDGMGKPYPILEMKL